ncbi:AMP-binding protein, partial [Cohnella faecalis]
MTIRNLAQLLFSDRTEGKGITFIRSASEQSTVSYRDLHREASLLLRHMQEAGLKPGNELVFQIEQNRVFLTWFWACMLGGIVPVPLTPGGSEENKKKLTSVWKKLNRPYLVAEADFWSRHSAESGGPGDEFGALLAEIGSERSLVAEWSELSGEPGQLHESSPEDIAFIQFSSGSTGEPKGVTLTHANLLANMRAIVECSGATGLDSSLSWMPMTHDMGLIGFHLTPIMAGMNQYLMLPALFIQHPTLWLNKANEHRITTLASPNFGYKHFLAHYKREQAKNWDLSSVRLIFNGAEPISASLCRQFLNEMNEYGLRSNVMFPVYGMAEASLAVTFPPAGEPLIDVEVERGSRTGQPVREHVRDENGDGKGDGERRPTVTYVDLGSSVTDCEVRICGEQDEPFSEGVIGEIHIRGRNVTRGYYNDEEATKRAFAEDGWLRTGDLGFMRGGRLVVTGRKKDVLFVNGQNVYPHDLEALLEEDEGGQLRRVAVCGVFNERLQSDEMIVFVLFRGKLQTFVPVAEQAERLIRKHAGFDVGAVLPVRQIPKTTSGKLQRYLLAQRFADGEFAREQRELEELRRTASSESRTVEWSEDELERDLQKMGMEALGTASLGVDDSFFENGGNSLKAALFVAAVQERLGVEIPIRELYGKDTVRELAGLIREAEPVERPNATAIKPAERREHYPLSEAQYRIYAQEQQEGIGACYNVPAALRIDGPFRLQEAERAFSELIGRHESLRTSFHLIEGEIAQRIDPGPVRFAVESIEADEGELPGLIVGFIRPFDLTAAPLFRARTIRLAEDRHVLLIDAHHAICDGISLTVLMEEFAELYVGKTLPSPGIAYIDYAAWYEGEKKEARSEKHRSYWSERLKGLPVLQMPTDYPRPGKRTFEGDAVFFELPEGAAYRIVKLAETRKISLYAAFLSVYFVLLHKYGAQRDIVVGSLLAGRDKPEVRRTVGMFNRFLPIRAEIPEEADFETFMLRVNDELMDAFDHQRFPIDDIAADAGAARDRSRNPLYDTMLILHNQMDGKVRFDAGGARFSRIDVHSGTSKLDFKLDLFPGENGRLDAVLEYNSSLFKRETMELFAERYARLLEAAAADPRKPIEELELLTEEERELLLTGFNDTHAAYRNDVLLHELIEEQAARTPDKIAFAFGDRKLTYRELNGQANRLARTLRAKGVGPESVVAVAMERSEEMMTALLAVLKAGGAYMPLSPDVPAERAAYMLGDSGARLALTQSGFAAEFAAKLAGTGSELLDVTEALLAGSTTSLDSETSLERLGTSRSPAYIIYTSGSTGLPKGVMVEHYSVVNRLNWMQKAYPLTERDVILQKTPYTFDVSVWELFWWGTVGASVLFLEPGGEKEPEAIVRAIEAGGATTIHFVPSMLSAFLDAVEGRPEQIRRLSGLRQVFASGEALTAKQA